MWLSHERLGYNYRMDELSAALGVAQMSRIEGIIAKREHVAAMYAERLARVPDRTVLRESMRVSGLRSLSQLDAQPPR